MGLSTPDRGGRSWLTNDQRPNLSSVTDYCDGGGADAARESAGKEPVV
jgi:hypothetical protein